MSRPISTPKLPLPVGRSAPHPHCTSLDSPHPQPKRHPDTVRCFFFRSPPDRLTDRQKHTVLVSLDLSAAFDVTDHSILLNRLNSVLFRRLRYRPSSAPQIFVTSRKYSVWLAVHHRILQETALLVSLTDQRLVPFCSHSVTPPLSAVFFH